MPEAGVIAAWLGILVTAGGALAGVVKFGFWVFDEWQKRKAHEGTHVPDKTLQLAPMSEGIAGGPWGGEVTIRQCRSSGECL
jgi:hypothetical protein